MLVSGMTLYGGYSKLKSTGLKIDTGFQYSASANGTMVFNMTPKLSFSIVQNAATVNAAAVGNSMIAAASLEVAGGGGNSFNDKGTSKTNPLENIKFTDKVKAQMKQGDYHSFPESVEGFGANGKVTKITGGDKIVRTKVEIPGSFKGKEGVFEYIIEPDGVTCNHRLFKPNK